MTAKERAAAAYRKIAEGYIELADINSEAAHGVADDLPPLQPMKDPGEIGTERIDRVPDVAMAPPAEGSLSQCPVHHKPYRDGKYGMFCASKADGAWSKKGWCSITPQNVDEYLRQVAAA